MKNFILILIPLIFLSSCDKELQLENSLKKQFKNYMQKVMNDPSSYEFVEITIVINERKRKQDSLDNVVLERYVDNQKLFKQIYDSQKENRNPSIKAYDKAGIIKYRGKNSFGAIILNESYIYVNSENQIYEIDGVKIR